MKRLAAIVFALSLLAAVAALVDPIHLSRPPVAAVVYGDRLLAVEFRAR
jgi:hypothetical protein